MIDITDVPLERNELPRLPCTRLPRYSKYCSWIGAFRLMSKSPEADAAASAYDIWLCCMSSSILISTGLPGMSRISPNVIVLVT